MFTASTLRMIGWVLLTPIVLATAYMLLEIWLLTLIPAHHLFALKGIHALNRVIAAIGKILLTDMLPFGYVIGRLR